MNHTKKDLEDIVIKHKGKSKKLGQLSNNEKIRFIGELLMKNHKLFGQVNMLVKCYLVTKNQTKHFKKRINELKSTG